MAFDPVARGLGARALGYPPTPVARLKRAFSQTPSALTGMSSPPTITKLLDNAVSGITNAVFVSANSDKVWSLNPLAVNFSGAMNDGVTRDFYTSFVNSLTATGPQMAAIWFDGQVLAALTNRTGSLLLVVDGQPATATQTSNASSSNNRYYQTYDFGSRAVRRIEIYYGETLAGFAIGPNDSIWAQDRGKELSIAFQTDSYGSTAGSVYNIWYQAATALGIRNMWGDVYGGSGYLQNNGANTNFLSRLNATTSSYAPDIYVVCGGINDTSAAAITSQLASYYATLRAKYPNTVIAAMGPWCPNGAYATDGGQKYVGIRDAIKEAVAGVGGPWLFIDNLAGKWNNSAGASGGGSGEGAWQTGSGKSGLTTGSGNGDLYVSSDGTHPTSVGVDYLAKRLAKPIREGVLAL